MVNYPCKTIVPVPEIESDTNTVVLPVGDTVIELPIVVS